MNPGAASAVPHAGAGDAPLAGDPAGPSLAQRLSAWTDAALPRLAGDASAEQHVVVGRVHSAADGLARVTGLRSARLNELLQFDGDRRGFVASLGPETLHAVLLDGADEVEVGTEVHGTGAVLQVPAGPGLLGRVLDPLGRPLDGLPPPPAATWLPVERPAPPVLDRALVREPVHTGTLVLDALFPLGRGQRELIIGDRGTGKTSIALDALIAQRDSDLICVYVAIGQKSESTASVIDAVRRYGAPERTLFVVSAPTDAPGLRWLAPFAGFSMAEYFRDRGQHALVVLDDLSHHAATHREMALLMEQPPGREAYPGDIFHLHARLLERAARLSPERGDGSLTALPVAQTDAGNLAAYIPTNLISITDGQIVLDSKLFHLGQLPAVDTGLSVSRVGGKTQSAAMRRAVSSLRLEYAQFLELEVFTRFGTELDVRVQAQIAHGRRIRALLAQPRLAPRSPTLELVTLTALQAGHFDALSAAELPAALARIATQLAAPQGLALTEALAASGPAGAAGDAADADRRIRAWLGGWWTVPAAAPAG